ncbi:hypothetical protein ACFLQY_04095 [Verrucomicrobiota bacterium]
MKKAFAATIFLLVVLLASGCATNGGVKRMIKENNAVYDQRIGLLAERVDVLSEAQESQRDNLLSYLKKQNRLLIEFIGQLEDKETAGATAIENEAPSSTY